MQERGSVPDMQPGEGDAGLGRTGRKRGGLDLPLGEV